MIDSLRSCYLCAKAHVIGYWCIGDMKTAVTVGMPMSHMVRMRNGNSEWDQR